MIKLSNQFNSDELQLTKSQLVHLINIVRKRWSKNKRANVKYTMGLTAFKMGIQLTDEETIKKIWGDLVKLTNAIIIYNDMMRLKNEQPSTEDMIKIFENKIESGEILDD